MQSYILESDSEVQIPPKKVKFSSSVGENKKNKIDILSKILLKEVQQEIESRKGDLEQIEENIFLTRQKLIHLKQAIAADYYQQKSVKGFLQYPPHPAVKDTFIGKCPAGVDYKKSFRSDVCGETETEVENNVENNIEKNEERSNENEKKISILNDDKFPCYIAPRLPDENFIKPFEPRDFHSKKEIRIVVGNVSKWLSPTESSDATHKWTVYAKIAEPDLDISLFVTKVVFFLHKSYRPNDVIEIKSPPFKLTRRGWGEFPLKTKFHFKNPSDPPIDVMHVLKLDHIHTGFETFGAETSLTVWVHYPLELNSVCDIKISFPESNIIENDSKNYDNDLLAGFKIEELQMNQKLFSLPKLKLENYLDKFDDFSIGSDIDCFKEAENSPSSSSEMKVENFHDFELAGNDIDNKMELETNFTLFNRDLFDSNKVLANEVEKKNGENHFKKEDKFPVSLYPLERGEDGLLTDECAVVGEEVIIDFDESNDLVAVDNSFGESYNLTNPELLRSDDNPNLREKKETFFQKSSLNAVTEVDFDSTETKTSLRSEEVMLVGSKNLRMLKNEKFTSNVEEHLDELVVHSKNSINSSNKNFNRLPPSMTTNTRVKKDLEKKSMIITLQKDDGQIILRKEAKVLKCKDNNLTNKKICMITTKESGLDINTPTSKPNSVIKNNKVVTDTNGLILPLKRPTIDKEEPNQELLGPNAVKSISTGWKMAHSGISILKRAKDRNLQNPTEDVSKRLSLVHNTEVAINWLMKKFPLIDSRSVDASFLIKHPYCAKSREDFLKWPVAKQRAAEWMRAKKIGRIISNIPHLANWSTLEILDWARVRCYTPMESSSGYNGPTLEPSLHFVYQPKISGILEFLNKQKMLAEEDIINVTTLNDHVNKKICSENTGINRTSHFSSNENCIMMPLDPEFEGYKNFIARCMKNSGSEVPLSEQILPDTVYPAVERVLISVFESLAEDLIRRSYNASWIRHYDTHPAEISVIDVKSAILSRKEFDFLLPYKNDKGKEQPTVISFFRK